MDSEVKVERPEVDPVFRSYLAYLVSQGTLAYMRRNATRPTVKIPNTSYWWGQDHTGYQRFTWHGPEAYSGILPPLYKDLYPEGESVELFAVMHQRRLSAVYWDAAKLAAYDITPEWIYGIDKVKELCDQNKWSEAMKLYLEVDNDERHSKGSAS